VITHVPTDGHAERNESKNKGMNMRGNRRDGVDIVDERLVKGKGDKRTGPDWYAMMRGTGHGKGVYNEGQGRHDGRELGGGQT